MDQPSSLGHLLLAYKVGTSGAEIIYHACNGDMEGPGQRVM